MTVFIVENEYEAVKKRYLELFDRFDLMLLVDAAPDGGILDAMKAAIAEKEKGLKWLEL